MQFTKGPQNVENIYCRLFQYRERASGSPLENFLTEGLADLFMRLPLRLQVAWLQALLPEACAESLTTRLAATKQLEADTQVSIAVGTSTKRPDIRITADGKPLALIEVKVDAAIQRHSSLQITSDNAPTGVLEEHEEMVVRDQLATYADWIRRECLGPWPGAVIFLTHRTNAPRGFEDQESKDSVIRSVRTWKEVGDWLAANLDLNCMKSTSCALAHDFHDFLEEQGLMTKFLTTRDLATTMLFLPSHPALRHTFEIAAGAVTKKFPKLRGGNLHFDFWPEGDSYHGWFFLNTKLNPPKAKFYIALGICFGGGELGSDVPGSVPRFEPYFFVLLEDEWSNKKASDCLTKIPNDWVQVAENYVVIVSRKVSSFSSDPDERASEFSAWAIEEIDHLVSCIRGFDEAPMDKAPPDEDE